MWLINDRASWNHHRLNSAAKNGKDFLIKILRLMYSLGFFFFANSMCEFSPCKTFLPFRNLFSFSLRRIFIKFNSFPHIVIPRKQFLLITESVPRDRLGRVSIGWRRQVNVTLTHSSTTGFHYDSHIQAGVPRRRPVPKAAPYPTHCSERSK